MTTRKTVYGGSVDAEGAAKPIQLLHRSGYASGLAVSQRGAGANMSVDVSVGGGLPVSSAGVGYFGWITAIENVLVDTADPTNPRKDIVVAYIDLSLISTGTTNNDGALKFKAVAGTAAASPSDPSDPTIQTAIGAGNPFIKLARLAVSTSDTSIVTGDITDIRTPMSLALPYLYGGASNTAGHLVPNIADDTVALLQAAQTLANKTLTTPTIADFTNATHNHTNATGGGASLGGVLGASMFSFVESNTGVWSGDSYASTRAASMTQAKVWLNLSGIMTPFTVAAVTSRTFTASKDTYVDVNTSGVLVYTEVSNNTASPALTSDYLRLGIIITGASTIADVGSVNQGQENKILPIASSTAYSVTDSLGNLICPRDPQRRILGYRQIVSNATATATSATQVAGLSVPVIVPAGRKVKVSITSGVLSNSTSATDVVSLWDGVVGVGTQLTQGNFIGSSGTTTGAYVEAFTTPTSTSKTYNGSLHVNAGTATFSATPILPAYVKVELN